MSAFSLVLFSIMWLLSVLLSQDHHSSSQLSSIINVKLYHQTSLQYSIISSSLSFFLSSNSATQQLSKLSNSATQQPDSISCPSSITTIFILNGRPHSRGSIRPSSPMDLPKQNSTISRREKWLRAPCAVHASTQLREER